MVMVTLKKTCAFTVVFSAWTPQQATVDPCLCHRLLDTHRKVWLSLLWGHCSYLVARSVHKALYFVQTNMYSKSVSPVLWKFCNKISLASKENSLGVVSPFADPQVGKYVVGPRTFLTV